MTRLFEVAGSGLRGVDVMGVEVGETLVSVALLLLLLVSVIVVMVVILLLLMPPLVAVVSLLLSSPSNLLTPLGCDSINVCV